VGTDTLACMEGLGNGFVPSVAAAVVVVANVVVANMLVGDDAAAVAGEVAVAGAGAGAGAGVAGAVAVAVAVADAGVAGEIALGAPVVTQEVDGDVVPLQLRWRQNLFTVQLGNCATMESAGQV
jgi:hypothetical protein